uniref:Uncharacterized protein n=1 Tax=Chromera velia CCMP2878 TaxID=1169474 RepID=A0A0G4GI57_9ALVE|eukprot:Cvel_21998.t1-p1 / transcript=Cvel_21998.t1 / gene=Cvel_21998 / organism=Chromera_velia_CCMP2878 / gene_product=hypothetical protein / transcript_product=hypothetical protein / location=Cvel_scaffold2119:30741-33866(+) / protein_length=619 / sequence_SO=supercontig / SO=protein_coding / is_pseudo=false
MEFQEEAADSIRGRRDTGICSGEDIRSASQQSVQREGLQEAHEGCGGWEELETVDRGARSSTRHERPLVAAGSRLSRVGAAVAAARRRMRMSQQAGTNRDVMMEDREEDWERPEPSWPRHADSPPGNSVPCFSFWSVPAAAAARSGGGDGREGGGEELQEQEGRGGVPGGSKEGCGGSMGSAEFGAESPDSDVGFQREAWRAVEREVEASEGRGRGDVGVCTTRRHAPDGFSPVHSTDRGLEAGRKRKGKSSSLLSPLDEDSSKEVTECPSFDEGGRQKERKTEEANAAEGGKVSCVCPPASFTGGTKVLKRPRTLKGLSAQESGPSCSLSPQTGGAGVATRRSSRLAAVRSAAQKSEAKGRTQKEARGRIRGRARVSSLSAAAVHEGDQEEDRQQGACTVSPQPNRRREREAFSNLEGRFQGGTGGYCEEEGGLPRVSEGGEKAVPPSPRQADGGLVRRSARLAGRPNPSRRPAPREVSVDSSEGGSSSESSESSDESENDCREDSDWNESVSGEGKRSSDSDEETGESSDGEEDEEDLESLWEDEADSRLPSERAGRRRQSGVEVQQEEEAGGGGGEGGPLHCNHRCRSEYFQRAKVAPSSGLCSTRTGAVGSCWKG